MAILDFFNMYSRGGWTKLCAHPVIPKGTDWTKVWFNGLKSMTFPVVFRQERDGTGSKLADFLSTGWGIGLGPASDRVINLLRDEGFTGWDTFPVEIYLKDGSRLLGYQGLVVTGKCGALDPAASEPIDVVDYTFRGWSDLCFKGFPLDYEAWDGSDIFTGPVDMTYHIFVSRRLRDAFRRYKISGIEFKRVEDELLPTFMSKIAPLLLDYWQPPIPHDDPLRDFVYLGDRTKHVPVTTFCPVGGFSPAALLRYRETPLPSLAFQHVPGRFVNLRDDFINCGLEFPPIVSSRFIEFLSAGHFSGWTAHPVLLTLDDGSTCTDFRFLSILGRCSRRNLSIPRPVPVEWVNPKRKTRSIGFKGFPLDISAWDGSDIFLDGDSTHVFVSARLAEAMQREKFQGIFYRNAADCLITDTLPFGDLFPLLNDFHGLSKK